MKNCCSCCVVNDVACPIKKCKYWIKYKDDLNCVLIAVEKNGAMTLRETADRMGISFVRVKQIQDKVLRKMQLKEMELFDD